MTYSSVWMRGSRPTSTPTKMCSKHNDLAPPEGGVDLSPTRWVCFTCFRTMRKAASSNVKGTGHWYRTPNPTKETT